MAEEKKTQLGTSPPRTHRPTGSQAPQPAALPKTSYLPETVDPLLGTTVAGRYLIVRKLGEGGMGAVYLATHTILEKHVALKVLHGEFARKPDLVERFMQEAKAASRIRHENVIDISDFGSTPEGLVFFAMELLQGHDLHQVIANAKAAGEILPWSRTKKVFLQICAALSAAHASGIVHRDLKPENIYLVEFLGDPDFVKLLDFGIAKVTEVSNEEGRKLTRTGMLFGTPEYMSPEQARGEAVDHRVDIYAMGCILFQMVTGQVPFTAENFMGVLSMHLTELPPQIAPETFDRIGAPRQLADVIDRALQKDRNERYQTIDELADALREACGDPPPIDRTQRSRPPTVPAPVAPVRTRPPTGPAPVAARKREPTGRIRTEWTGNLKVPEIEVVELDKKKPRSKLPLVLGALVLAGAGAAVAIVVMNRGGTDAQPQAGGASSAVAATPPAPPPAAPPAPPPVVEPPLPAMVKLQLDSIPHGATVTDLSTGRAIGKTPAHVSIPGSKTPRQFRFQLRGYADTTVELVPDRDSIDYSETLQKGAAGAAVVHKVSDATLKTTPAAAGSAEAPVTTPEPAPVTQPESGSASEAKPPDVKPPPPPKDNCPDDPSLPCLKGFGSNGSGS